MGSWLVVGVSLGYIGLLFGVAWLGDRRGAIAGGRAVRHAPVFYALTLAVYTTGWSFYGHIGRAATDGFDFLPIYLGPVLMLTLGQPVLRRVLAVAKSQTISSIADFIAARYGKSHGLGALVAAMAVIGVLPYIALQLRSVSTSYEILTHASVLPAPAWRDTGFFVAIAMAAFAILFGVRHIHASEHHRGLMLAIAFESLVKLAAFVTVAGFIVFGMFDGIGDLLARATEDGRMARVLSARPFEPAWWSTTLLAAMAVLTLPQKFHVAIVENQHPGDLRSAALLFPCYLAILAIFMVPVAVAGLLTFAGQPINPDTFMIALPIAAGEPEIGLLAFIGGLSASTGMVIVATVALSTMVCNDIVVPLLLRRSDGRAVDLSGRLLLIRRIAVVAILLLAYAVHRNLSDAYSLSTIGMLSFAAVGQFGPALFGGLLWERGNRRGALAGLSAGFLLWGYTLLWPAVADGLLGRRPGPAFGLAWLNPTSLFGLNGLDMVSHATLVSLSANLALYLLVSLLTGRNAVERQQAGAFRRAVLEAAADTRVPRGQRPLRDLLDLAARFVGRERAEQAFARYLMEHAATLGGGRSGALRRPADLGAIRFTERLLAGAIGAASARVVVATGMATGNMSRGEAMAMLDDASSALQLNRDLLVATLDNMSQGICVLDRDMAIAAWNRRFVEVLELPDDFVQVGLPLAELIAFMDRRGEFRETDFATLLLNRDRADEYWPYTYERVRPDGTILEVATTKLPDGGYVSTYTDVTERHRTAAMAAAKAEAERANLGKTRFLAAASHDLLQPLNAARLFASALVERKLAPGEAGLAAKLDTALQSVEQLLGALLDISKFDAGGVTIERRPFAIAPLMATLAAEVAGAAEAKGLRLVAIPSDAVVETDPMLLRRILQNFLANAVRYTETGGVLIGCRRRGDQLRIEVWDTGIGIAPDQQAAVFEEFRRLGGGTAEGLGLGLAIVDRLARRLGHPVALRSVPGRGSCFAVTVPLGTLPAVEVPVPRSATGDLAGLRLLCLDNDPAILAGLTALLGNWGCEVRTAETPEAALAGERPDVILADLHLGEGRSGLDAIRQMRARWGSVPGILVTADRSDQAAAEAARLGCPLLHKPIQPARLRAALAHLTTSPAALAGED